MVLVAISKKEDSCCASSNSGMTTRSIKDRRNSVAMETLYYDQGLPMLRPSLTSLLVTSTGWRKAMLQETKLDGDNRILSNGIARTGRERTFALLDAVDDALDKITIP
jgi:hypothetical protein